MCTTAAKRLDNSWFLLKTRDPVSWMRWDDEIKLFEGPDDRYKKLIIQNPDPNQDGYYGGINDRGVAFVSTFVRVAEDQVSYIRRPYIRLILDASTAKEAVSIIEAFNPRIGGNMFVADRDECYGIEGSPKAYFIEQVAKSAVKTNHYLHLPDVNLSFATKPDMQAWTETHFSRATELLAQAESLADFQALLRDRAHAGEKRAICTIADENPCFTHSAFIFDTRQACVHYCQGNPLTNEFIKYQF